ncbi:hypothetical protein BJX61DRAFT_514849 [Aspergillus egyptiacus]|nr:hypothetical protein BJX61DRAFT_514849 [Aspergillus egyptiacus]
MMVKLGYTMCGDLQFILFKGERRRVRGVWCYFFYFLGFFSGFNLVKNLVSLMRSSPGEAVLVAILNIDSDLRPLSLSISLTTDPCKGWLRI